MSRLLALVLLVPGVVFAEEPVAPIEVADEEPADAVEEAGYLAPSAGWSEPVGAKPALEIHGYLDVGAAQAQGDGTSWHAREERLPVDYAADPFATAVNSRGDVASADPGGRFTNGFLPRSLDLGGRASPFLSTVSLDLRWQPEASKLFAFVRLQLLPRLDASGLNHDRLLLQQAFVRLIPLESEEFAVTVGRFDSVFGIEYLDNEAPIRTGITPSLSARYTTGWQLGAKAFYRFQLPALWSALSLNAAITTNSSLVEALQPSAVSLTGLPMFSARAGYELNLPGVQLKLGASASRGARTDQTDPSVLHRAFGGDARLVVGWFSLAGEYVHLHLDEGGADKAGAGRLVSELLVDAFRSSLAVGIPVGLDWLHKVTPYVAYGRRLGGFTGFAWLDNDRITGGVRLDLGDHVVLKAEYLRNEEHPFERVAGGVTTRSGAARVDNDVVTSSLVVMF